jgi:tetratricopeptide (TPR) repeat protein
MSKSSSKTVAVMPSNFGIACGLFACVAFTQLLSVGVAIAARTGETREVIRYIQDAPLIVSVPTPVADTSYENDTKPRSVNQIIKEYSNMDEVSSPQSSSSFDPPLIEKFTPTEPVSSIADPVVEQLLIAAKKAHNQGDLVKALNKIDEAESQAPEEIAVSFCKALIYEDLGKWQAATAIYDKIFLMGPGVGHYYDKSSYKLSNGIHPQTQKLQPLSMGKIMLRSSNDQLENKLTIPILCQRDGDFDPEQLEIKVHHYDIVDKKNIEAVPPSRAANIQNRWLNEPLDWANNEETAESKYTLPPPARAEEHLFGKRTYFGYVAELYHKNELVDQQAHPGRLHAIHAEQQYKQRFPSPFDFPIDEVSPDINPNNPLLPALPRH